MAADLEKQPSSTAPKASRFDNEPDNDSSGDVSRWAQWQDDRKEKRRLKRKARNEWKKTGVGWRVFPRTLLGILCAIMVFSVGAGVSGAVLFAYYEARVTQSENKIAEFSAELDRRVAEGIESISVTSNVAEERINATLGPFSDLVQNENGLPGVAEPSSGSLVLVETADKSGTKQVGTAVAVGRSVEGTVFVTSLNVVDASTSIPGPEITLRKGNSVWPASLDSWDQKIGMALLISKDADLPAVPFAPLDNLGIITGSPVFSLSALNNSVVVGSVAAVTRDGFRHTGVADQDFRGGPIVGQSGEVLGFSNNSYAPSGVPGGSVPWAPTIVQLCEVLLRCESSNATPR